VTDVINFDQHMLKLKVYRGDVTNFEAVRAEDRARQTRQHEVQEAKRSHLQTLIDGKCSTPKEAKQRKSRMKKMERLGVEAAGEGKKFKLSDQQYGAEEVRLSL